MFFIFSTFIFSLTRVRISLLQQYWLEYLASEKSETVSCHAFGKAFQVVCRAWCSSAKRENFTLSCFNYATRISHATSLTHIAKKSLENRSITNSIMTKTLTPALEHRYQHWTTSDTERLLGMVVSRRIECVTELVLRQRNVSRKCRKQQMG